MNNLLLAPPIAFAIILALSIFLSVASAGLAFRKAGVEKALNKAYTGGEDLPVSRVQPDYSEFFPFAFFFTILNVVTLMLATVPKENFGSFLIAVIYIVGAMLGLFILFRRN